MNRVNPNQNGATLVSALLIMSLITAIAVGLSVAIMNMVNTTRDINYSITSFYAADSALDQGLWTIKQARYDDLSIDDTLDKLGRIGNPDVDTLSDPRAAWKRTAVTANETVKFDLGTEQSVVVELYNPISGVPADAPQKIQLWWHDSSGLAKVQVSWVGWTQGGFNGGNGDFFPYPSTCDASGDCTGDIVNVNDPALPTRIYLRIRAKDHGITNLTVQSLKGDGTVIDIPSQIVLTVIGEYPTGIISSKQALSAAVPWLVPVSGLYSYVLYSETALNK